MPEVAERDWGGVDVVMFKTVIEIADELAVLLLLSVAKAYSEYVPFVVVAVFQEYEYVLGEEVVVMRGLSGLPPR